MELCLCGTANTWFDLYVSYSVSPSATLMYRAFHFYRSFILASRFRSQISVAISDSSSLEAQYLSLQRALFLNPFLCVLGAFFFSMCSLYLLEAKEAVHQAVEGGFCDVRCDSSPFGDFTLQARELCFFWIFLSNPAVFSFAVSQYLHPWESRRSSFSKDSAINISRVHMTK